MARRTAKQPLPDDFEEHILDTDIRDEMQSSFLEYAYSVIYSRALPDARDGLKPVQRRILYTMDEMSLRPDRGHVKSARVVGEVMGRLHPHGDGAIYDALVRMAQPWSMRLPTVDGHGNFGSPDDSPAAMRYTECRMAPAAVAMTASIDEETVDFKPNYDSREMEPVVLPAAIPHLLVNGAAGIAVGMATNIAPHNLVEVVQALKHLITHPQASLDDLMRFVPGPDLPTGGKIVGLDGIRDAYESGRGTFRMRATARVESVTARRKGIVVTELPYGVGTERVMEQIKKLVLAKKLQGIADIKDLSDREHGLRLVVEVKNGFVPEAILEQLYRQTALEDTFGINAVALVDGQPRTLGLKEMLDVFLGHRFEVVRRRSTFRRTKAADRLHLVDGLLVAILDIDEVIQVIRTSDNAAAAKERLISVFDLSEAQADYILDMPLRRLTRFSKLELEKEKAELERTIELLDAILADEKLLRKVVSDELTDMAKQHGTPRRTVLLASAGNTVTAATPVEVADDPCFALLSSSGLLARTSSASTPGRGEGRANHDVVVSAVRTTARGEVGVLTSRGRLLRVGVLDMPELPRLGQRPQPPGRLPAQRDAAPPARRARPGALVAADRWTRPRAGHPRRHRQAGQPRGPRTRRVGGHRTPGGRRGRRGRRARDGRGGAVLHLDRCPAPPLPRSRRPSAGPGRWWHGRHQARCRAAGRLLRRLRADRRGRGHRVRVLDRPAGHRGRLRQGHALQRLSREGPRHRRRAQPPLPPGRGHPRRGLGRPGARACRGRQRRSRRPARGQRPARRVRHARGTADRRRGLARRRTGRRPGFRGSRARAHSCGRLTPCPSVPGPPVVLPPS